MSDRPAFQLFRGYAASAVLSSLHMAGLIGPPDRTTSEQHVDVPDTRGRPVVLACLEYLRRHGLVDGEGQRYRLTEAGSSVYRDASYLVWLHGGYGRVLAQLPELLTGRAFFGVDITRDGRWVADASALIGRIDFVPQAMEILADVDFTRVLDLGCGNARFLLRVCQRFGAVGTGVDISLEACERARREVEESDVDGRVTIRCQDAVDLDSIPGLATTDLVVTFALLHEILHQGLDVLVGFLTRLADALPTGARLLTLEVAPADPDAVHDGWAPEFTLVHALMGQRLFTARQWTEALREGGFRTRSVTYPPLPNGMLLLAENTR
ncbi:SAM-dependent methyltransferase [Streptoalloteichus hindustanus]|uniref:Methyltransferase domain-containing protein n=1 Tax=Streptoalloteichus hindustanus TaxID=2017 RepID=A0A1M5CXR6_STRHI|nr:class I SAM-dependent methyltransferase [Streptoalloteichus hindustanus]SHF59454.1 Methyltransferase domain-containing protein [Streptoalloteichus hindustanus]